MLFVSIILFTIGAVISLFGAKLFKLLAPIIALVAGSMVGFAGFQAVFGTGAVSTTLAIFVAIIVGILLALFSYVFVEIALNIYAGILGASILSFLGVSLGLKDLGFVMLMLAVAGFLITYLWASSVVLTPGVVIAITSYIGTGLILSSVFLLLGEVTIDQLSQTGIIPAIIDIVDQSFLWLLVWIGGGLVATQAQARILLMDHLPQDYQFKV